MFDRFLRGKVRRIQLEQLGEQVAEAAAQFLQGDAHAHVQLVAPGVQQHEGAAHRRAALVLQAGMLLREAGEGHLLEHRLQALGQLLGDGRAGGLGGRRADHVALADDGQVGVGDLHAGLGGVGFRLRRVVDVGVGEAAQRGVESLAVEIGEGVGAGRLHHVLGARHQRH
ncbi:hypothetical protein D3C78_781770 [compost metagenome]